MSDVRYPMLDLFYQQYLTDENSAMFIHSVSRNYGIGTLERLARFGGRLTRRAAILAIGFVGDYSANEIMGDALVDSDRAVRLLADHGIREVWQRQGTISQQQAVQTLYQLNSQQRMEEVIQLSTTLIKANSNLGEAWNQRAIAYCALGEFEAAIDDCRETLACNRFHFPAAMGMAHCYMQLDDAFMALDGFRLSLQINPDLEGVRNHISKLERTLEDG
ncbi:MAG: tetratricopeptide repeat protein [Mariniblastus sp.]|nr:tetratricopeptide repeat protein [Mariniblastus sp.]